MSRVPCVAGPKDTFGVILEWQLLGDMMQQQFSNDGKWYWDGTRWMSTVSPDGRYRWTGTRWAPVRRMLLGDYANQSIACAILGLLCGVAFALGLVAGYVAYRDLPWKRTQATVGMILNAIGLGLWIVVVIADIASVPR